MLISGGVQGFGGMQFVPSGLGFFSQFGPSGSNVIFTRFTETTFQPIIASGGTGNYTYSIDNVSQPGRPLPEELTFNTSTGVLSGTILNTSTGVASDLFRITLSDGNNSTSTTFNIVTQDAPLPAQAGYAILDILLVGGGGGGGTALTGPGVGGGGGAGGIVYRTDTAITTGSWNILIGMGGPPGTKGTDTVLKRFFALGGGEGGSWSGGIGGAGGSGGGSTNNAISGSGLQYLSTSSGLGFAGGQTNSSSNAIIGGGGGGAGGVGNNGYYGLLDPAVPIANWRDGGPGVQINITGTNYYYAGGGGGAINTNAAGGNSGLGGGGTGSKAAASSFATSGLPNSGGGGGGATNVSPFNYPAGSGGSGIAVLKIRNAPAKAVTFSSGVRFYTITNVPNYTIYVITATTNTSQTVTISNVQPSLTLATATVSIILNSSTLFQPVIPAGGTGKYTFSLSPALPTGLTLNSQTGIISGSPSVVQNTTTYTITLSEPGFNSTSTTFTIDVDSFLTFNQNFNQVVITRNSSTSFQPVSAVGGSGIYSYSVSPALPSSLTINTSTGLIVGTALNTQSFTSYTVTINDTLQTTSTSFSLRVDNTLTFTTTQSGYIAIVNSATSFQPIATVSGGSAVYFYNTGSFLPNGFSLNTTTGIISGTPTAYSTASFYTLRVSDGYQTTSTRFAIRVDNILSATTVVSNLVISTGTAMTPSTPVTANTGGAYGHLVSFEYFLVAGGGGGGKDIGGGGGAGGVFSGIYTALTATITYDVQVGGGGTGSSSNANGGVGADTRIYNSTGASVIFVNASGGGGGATRNSGGGSNGGSGGGGTLSVSAGLGSPGQGFPGVGGTGTGLTAGSRGGGGGGAGSTGSGKNGGTGIQSLEWAIPTNTGVNNGYYAGGGAAGQFGDDLPLGIGGLGGGANGTLDSIPDPNSGLDATPGTGGGGGGQSSSASGKGGNGASGVAIIRELGPGRIFSSVPKTNFQGYVYHAFTNTSASTLNYKFTGTGATFSISPSLPVGLNFNSLTGQITGTAVTTSSGALYTVTVSDGVQTTSSNFSLTIDPRFYVDYLLVGGGGGTQGIPNSGGGGGGGGGGFVEVLDGAFSRGVGYSITVGAGGAQSPTIPQNGGNTTFAGTTAYGGGRSSYSNPVTTSFRAGDGGSGGGGVCFSPGNFGNNIYAGQGYPGTAGSVSSNCVGGGGGGAGGPAGGATGGTPAKGGDGGAGRVSQITGATYGGGGGGASDSRQGAAGPGGGGAGGSTQNNGANGLGGGGGGRRTSLAGSNGGSGVIVLRIPNAFSASFSGATVSTDSSSQPGFIIYTITAATGGTVTFN